MAGKAAGRVLKAGLKPPGRKDMMSQMLVESLKTIENYKTACPEYNDLLDILGDILILRQEYKARILRLLFPIDERLIEKKVSGGLPLVDLSRAVFDLAGPKGYFLTLLEAAEKRNPGGTSGLGSQILSGEVDFEGLLRGSFDPGENYSDEPQDDSFDLIDLFLEECLRPDLELVAEKYGPLVRAEGWSEGYCPICGREPKIGEIKDEEEDRHLFCYQCGFQWSFDPGRCPFCGNEEQQSLAYFTIEDEERYRVDVCNACKRYIKVVDSRDSEGEPDLDVEDIATLHLDIMASEEGYN